MSEKFKAQLHSETYTITLLRRDMVALEKSGLLDTMIANCTTSIAGSRTWYESKDCEVFIAIPYSRTSGASGPSRFSQIVEKAVQDAYDFIILGAN
jgi:hypothetical protein